LESNKCRRSKGGEYIDKPSEQKCKEGYHKDSPTGECYKQTNDGCNTTTYYQSGMASTTLLACVFPDPINFSSDRSSPVAAVSDEAGFTADLPEAKAEIQDEYKQVFERSPNE
jgi:hypothetical protein